MTAAARILVVEDSPTQAAALAALLEDAGFVPVLAKSGERAMELLRGESPDPSIALVLSDVVMPGMDGYELCRRVKAEPWGARIPVVLLTSLGDPLALVRGLESGADHYVTKPYEPERLVARVRQVIASPPAGLPPIGRPIDVAVLGGRFTIAADKEHIVALLVSSYEDLVRTSEAVRAAEQRARFLAEAGERLSASLDAVQLLGDLARMSVPRIADLCLVDVLDEQGQLRRTAAESGDPAHQRRAQALLAHVERWDAAVADPTGAAAIVPLDAATIERVTDGAAHRLLLEETGAREALVVPLTTRGATVGRLTLVQAGSGRTFAEADLELAAELARRAALALDNARLYRLAQEATQSRDDMLAIVSHDLRNPIHTIQMSSSFMLELLPHAADPEAIAKQVTVIRRAAARANTLIGDLLDVSRIEAGRLSVSAAPVDARAFLDEVMTELAPLARAKPVTLAYEWTGDTATMALDRGRVAQVLSNLVGNAIKFTPAGGTIAVRGCLSAGEARIVVQDSGPGIAADNIPHLFDRFWQAERGARHGAGLGLFIARGIVEAHGGRIEVESAEGEGARFAVRLPVA